MLSILTRHPLLRDLAIVLGVKFALILLAAVFLFNARHRPHIDADVMLRHLLPPSPPP
jgi:hypothetical protein